MSTELKCLRADLNCASASRYMPSLAESVGKEGVIEVEERKVGERGKDVRGGRMRERARIKQAIHYKCCNSYNWTQYPV